MVTNSEVLYTERDLLQFITCTRLALPLLLDFVSEKRDVDVSQGLESHRVLALPSRNRTSIKVYEGMDLWLHFLQGGVEVKVETEKKRVKE